MTPGPRGLPLIGSTLAFQKDPLGFCTDAVRRYGDVVHFRIALDDWYLLADPADVHDVLVKRAALFHKPRIARRIWKDFLGNGLLSTDGDYWKRQHAMILPGFHRERIEAYGEIMVRYTDEMLAGWKDGDGIDFCSAMTDLTLAIVAKTLFDADVKRDAPTVRSAMQVLNQALVDHINMPLPVPRWWPSRTNRRKLAAIAAIEGIVRNIVAERRRGGVDRGDLLSMLVFARDEAGGGMNDTELRDELMTLVFAGHETTSHALTWMWYLLGSHPLVAEKLAAELRRVLGDRPPAVADLPSLPYLEMVVKESMRLLPSVWTFMREPTEDVVIGGQPVPKGAYLFMSPFVIHRDPRWYPEPEAFRPERFSKEGEAALPKGSYIPFSMGPRVCLGKSFAMMEARLILGTLVQRLRPVLAEGYRPILNPKLSLSPKNGLPAEVAFR